MVDGAIHAATWPLFAGYAFARLMLWARWSICGVLADAAMGHARGPVVGKGRDFLLQGLQCSPLFLHCRWYGWVAFDWRRGHATRRASDWSRIGETWLKF